VDRHTARSERGTPARGARRRSRGVVLLEFALAAPFLFLVVFGVVDGCRALVTWVELKNAAREGAVFAQSHPHQWRQDAAGDAGGLCDEGDTVTDRALAEGDTTMTVTVTYADGSTLAPDFCRLPASSPITAGTRITVQTTAEFEAITPFAGRFFETITARASTRTQG
jgi:Flp pilus assembly protein TadG